MESLLQEIQNQISNTDTTPSQKYQLAKQNAVQLYLTGALSRSMVINICAGIVSAYLTAEKNKDSKK